MPSKGFKFTEESKRKMSESQRTRFLLHGVSVETRRRIGEASRGHKLSEEARRKISLANTGRRMSEEDKKRVGDFHRGKKMSAETRAKMSRSRKGMKFSEEWRKNMANVRRGSKSHLWRGGITDTNMKIRNSLEYKIWRAAVFERDSYTCIWCKTPGGWSKEQKRKINLNADHIKRFALYPELRLDINNGRTLCEDCHKKTGTFGRLSPSKIPHWNLTATDIYS